MQSTLSGKMVNAFFLKNYEYSEFDFTKNNQIQIELYAGKLEGNLIYAENPYQAIEEYTSYCGRMQPLPAWIVSGAIIGMQGGTAKLYDIWQKMKNADFLLLYKCANPKLSGHKTG